MRMKFIIILAATLLIYGGSRIAIFEIYKTSEKPTLIIVSSIPLSRAPKDIVRSAQLAFDKYAKTVTFANLTLDIRDDTNVNGRGSDENKLRRNVQEFAGDPRAIAYFGPTYSLAAKMILPILNQAHLPTLSPTCSLPSLTRSGFAINEPSIYQPTHERNFVRLSTTDDADSYNAALWLKELGVRRVVVVDDQSLDYSSTILYTNNFQTTGVTIADRYVLTASSTRDVARKIIQQNPDLVYYQGISDVVIEKFLRDLKSSGYSGALMSEDTAIAKIDTTKLSRETEGMYITSLTVPLDQIDNERAKSFSESYLRKYGEKPTSTGVLAYDGMKILIDSIAQSDGTREGVNKILLSTKNRPSIFGQVTFDGNGDNSGTMVGRGIIHDGRLQFQRSVMRSELFND